MNIIPAERRARIMTIINENGFAQVSSLSNELGVSELTIRRDLQILEKEGGIIRKRGGAISRNKNVTMEVPYSIKQVQNPEIKKRIASAAATLIEDGNSIILDSGSTTFALSQLLASRKRLTVVTNDLYIATKLGINPDIKLICTGGIIRPNVFSMQGTLAENCIRNFSVEYTILGADAIHNEQGIFNVNTEEIPIKQAMIESAKKVILLVDSSKFKIRGFAKVCDLSSIHCVITDEGITSDSRKIIRDHIQNELIIV